MPSGLWKDWRLSPHISLRLFYVRAPEQPTNTQDIVDCMSQNTYSNVIGFDDAPFPHHHRGNVMIVGTIYTGLRFDGVITGAIRRDGANSANNIINLIRFSRFKEHIQLIMLQGIAMAGFNVVDILKLNRRLQVPVLVVARYKPDMIAIRNALLNKVRSGQAKWDLIESLGPMEAANNLYVQTAGLNTSQAKTIIERFAVHGNIPEPLRTAHLIAGALGRGQSRGRP